MGSTSKRKYRACEDRCNEENKPKVGLLLKSSPAQSVLHRPSDKLKKCYGACDVRYDECRNRKGGSTYYCKSCIPVSRYPIKLIGWTSNRENYACQNSCEEDTSATDVQSTKSSSMPSLDEQLLRVFNDEKKCIHECQDGHGDCLREGKESRPQW